MFLCASVFVHANDCVLISQHMHLEVCPCFLCETVCFSLVYARLPSLHISVSLPSSHRSTGIGMLFSCIWFYVCPKDLNLDLHVCAASSFTHWAISQLALDFLIWLHRDLGQSLFTPVCIPSHPALKGSDTDSGLLSRLINGLQQLKSFSFSSFHIAKKSLGTEVARHRSGSNTYPSFSYREELILVKLGKAKSPMSKLE